MDDFDLDDICEADLEYLQELVESFENDVQNYREGHYLD